jgi:hypothetical protein
MHHGCRHPEKLLKICLGGSRTMNLGVVVDEGEVLPLLGCERLAHLHHCHRTFLFIRKPTIKYVQVGSYTASNARRTPCLGCDMAGEIVHIVERQVNNESRSERLCGLVTFFQLGINKRALSDQIALTWGQPEVDSVVWLDPRPAHVGELSDGRPLFLGPGTSAANGHRPVLERQPVHAAELSSVVRDEPEPQRARVGGDEEIIGSDHLAAPL